MGQKLILGGNFKNKISDDFYILHLCFYNTFDWNIKNCKKTIKLEGFLAIFEGPIKKYYKSKVVVHKNRR